MYLAIVGTLCFANFSSMPQIKTSITLLGIPADKLVHFTMFLPFNVLSVSAYKKQGQNILLPVVFSFIAGCAIAAGTEYGQALLTSYRSGDPLDFVADFAGLLLGAIATFFILRRKR